jgi:hypothetical protein
MDKKRSVWFVDVMIGERYIFTLRYKHCPAFKFDIEDVHRKVLEKRPSLKDKEFEMYIY